MHKLSGSTNAVGVIAELILAVLNANVRQVLDFRAHFEMSFKPGYKDCINNKNSYMSTKSPPS